MVSLMNQGSLDTTNGVNGEVSEKTPLVQKHAAEGGAVEDHLSKQSAAKQNRTFWSRLTFQWFVPVLDRGNAKKKLDQEDLDLVPLPNDCTTDYVIDAFEKYWEQEKHQYKDSSSNTTTDNGNNVGGGGGPSLVRALWKAFGTEYIRAGMLKLVNDLMQFVGPMVLKGMIEYLRSPDAPLWHGIVLIVAVTCSQILMSVCLRHYFFKCYATGLRIRSAIVMAVYRKALVLSAAERQARTLGEITNLTSIDAQRLQDLTTYLHAWWYSPLQIFLSLFFLWRQLGPSSLGGVLVICIMIPGAKFIAQWMGSMQQKLMHAKDARVNLNSEVLAGMKIIKFQSWEDSFQKRISDLREVELKNLLRYFLASSLSDLLWTFTPLAVALATFAAYIWSGHVLDVASALTALALFDILQFPLFMLPRIINNTVEAAVSLKRIRNFLLCDEYKPIGPNGLEYTGVRMDNVSAVYDSKKPVINSEEGKRKSMSKEISEKEWELELLQSQLREAEKEIRRLTGKQLSMASDDADPSLLCLKRIDFECKAGDVVAVVGGVGCGKTTFLNAVLGEVRELGGTTSVNGKLAYFSQTPFIMNTTIRDNILFGHVEDPVVDEERYQRAIDCCALRHDLALLPYGDATEIGEKGVTLSGGQRARVGLARAVYHCADITLIDDALSAVDAHVAEHLFEQAILGELMKPKASSGQVHQRCVILTTNAIQFLKHPAVTKVVVIQDGAIAEEGSYDDLSGKENSVFSRFLAVMAETGISDDGNQLANATDEEDETESSKRRRSSINEEAMEEIGTNKLMTEEARAFGHVGASVYFSWLRAAGGLVLVPAVIIGFYTLGSVMNVLTKWFLTYWSVHGDATNQVFFLGIYALINISASFIDFIQNVVVLLFGLKASRTLFREMLATVLHAPQSFFDTTPIGRLVNRFSKDIYTLDEQLMNTLTMYLSVLFTVVSTVVVISGVTPIFIIVLIPLIAFYVKEQSFFTVTYRELKRLDSSNRSPIFALLGESVDGVAVIRSFSAEGSLVRRLKAMIDAQQHAYYLTCTAQSWLAIRLELIGTSIIAFAALSSVVEHQIIGADETFAGLAGLALSYALSVTNSLNWSVRMASDMEASMIAVERIKEYTTIQNEGIRHTFVDRILVGWPSKGLIEFKGAKLRYRPGLPLVLKGLDITIPGGSKVGVVGRTGAGKSTLVISLLRIAELCEGRIMIDGQDIRKIGLALLRSQIAVIPQDPVLYSGTVRSNLDPFGQYYDHRLCESLERVGLWKGSKQDHSEHSVQSTSYGRIDSLDEIVSEGGTNFSVGQRQLLVIARALLHGSMIVLMDEATASVSVDTDALIQKVMREEFKNATVITVAHRLNTIMDSDYILVMADGRAVEFDSPKRLMEKGGYFRELVRAASRD